MDDATASMGTIDALSQRLALESLLTSLASTFLQHHAHDLEASIDRALAEVASFAKVDRAFLYLLDEERRTIELTARWARSEPDDEPTPPGSVDQQDLPTLLGTLRSLDSVYVPSFSATDASLDAEWRQVQPTGAAALLVVPLVGEGELVGFTGFDMAATERMWSDGHVTVLASLAGIVVQALARSDAERRFGLAFDRAPLGMALHAPNGRHVQVNAAYCELMGRSADELIGRTLLELVHPEDHPEIEAKHRPLLKGEGDLLVAEVRVPRGDETCWVRIHASAVRAPNGSLRYTVGHFEDTTERVTHEQELASSEERYRTLVENLPTIVIRVDDQLTITYISPAIEELANRPPERFVGNSDLFDLGEEGARWRRALQSVLRTGRRVDREWSADIRGVQYWFQSRAVPERGRDGDITHVLVVNTDITALKRSEAELAHQALHDPLTGLANRALFLDHLTGALARAERRPGSVAVLFLDLDRFKLINDSMGHSAGDQLLEAVAERLHEVVRPGDTVARLGGDEFVVLLEDLAEPRQPVEVAGRLREALGAPLVVGGNEVFVTTSIGIATSTDATVGPEGLLRDADAAMYLAKARGRDRYEIFDEVLRTEAAERLAMESALRRSLDLGELVVHYQPEVHLDSIELLGCEALARWQHPERGLLDAGAFIGLAEETGLILDIGALVLEQACAQYATWRAEGRLPAAPLGGNGSGAGPAFELRVNLSARQLSQADLVDRVADALARYEVPAAALCLEITETALMADPEWGLATLRRLHDLGLRLAIDDFGTGYSSLSYLKRFPVQVVKIDQSFVAGLGVDRNDEAIVRAVLALAGALDLDVIAEGVETSRQRDELRQLGVARAQGYLFSRAVPPEQLWDVLGELSGLDSAPAR